MVRSVRAVRVGRDELQARRPRQRQELPHVRRGDGQNELGAHGGAHRPAPERVGTAGKRDDTGGAERAGAPQNRAEIARILHAVHGQNERHGGMQQAGRGMLRAGAKDQDSLVATSLHDGLQDARRGPQDWNTRTAQAAQNVPSLPRLLEVRSDEGLVERGPGPEGLLREVQAPGDIDGVALPEGLVALEGARPLDGAVLRAVDGPFVPGAPPIYG